MYNKADLVVTDVHESQQCVTLPLEACGFIAPGPSCVVSAAFIAGGHTVNRRSLEGAADFKTPAAPPVEVKGTLLKTQCMM